MKRRAFTLIELIIVLLVVAIIMIPLASALRKYLQGTYTAEEIRRARDLAQTRLEELRRTVFDQITNTTLTNYKTSGMNLVQAVSYVQGGASTPEAVKKIEIELRWPGAANPLLTVETYRAKNSFYGPELGFGGQQADYILVSTDAKSVVHNPDDTYSLFGTSFLSATEVRSITLCKLAIEFFFRGILPFNMALFGDSSVALNGNVYVDSYDSTVGPYNPWHPNENGSVGSNSLITGSGSVEVHGDLASGGTVVLNPSKTMVTGDIIQGAPLVELPDIDQLVAYYATDNDNAQIGLTSKNRSPLTGTDFSLGGNESITLPNGRYYFTSMSLGANSYLYTGGDVLIFLAGPFSISGGSIANPDYDATSATIISSGSSVILNGTPVVCGAIYAPYASVTFTGNVTMFGCVVGRTLSASGSVKVHYDEALGNQNPTDPPASRLLAIKINGIEVFSGNAPSGSLIDIQDFTIEPSLNPSTLEFVFDGSTADFEISLRFVMEDDTFEEVHFNVPAS